MTSWCNWAFDFHFGGGTWLLRCSSRGLEPEDGITALDVVGDEGDDENEH